MIQLQYIEIKQPIGTFYFSKINAQILGDIVNVTPRSANPNAIQRDESKDRINEIAKYCNDPDATFPTPIIISIYDDSKVTINDNYIQFELNEKIGEVIDGQHRLKGILKSNVAERFELPLVLLFNLTEEEKAYIFSIINSKQTKVSMSLIYDLFSLSKFRSPQKTAHEIARVLNKSNESPFHNRLKMLGNKESQQEYATLSQGTFVKHFIDLISKDPDEDLRKSKSNERFEDIPTLPLRQYFVNNEDEIILKITLNLFNALKEVFTDEWKDPNKNILWKSTGYVSIIKSFNEIYKIGDSNNDLSKEFFLECFKKFQTYLKEEGLELTSEFFPSNAQQQSRLSKLILESLK